MKSIIKTGTIFGLLVLSACVPARKFEDVQAKYETCQEENAALKRANQGLENENTELASKMEEIQKRMTFLAKDTTVLGTSLRQMTRNYDQLDRTYRELLELNDRIQKGNSDEISKMRLKINETQAALIQKEDDLKKLEMELTNKSKNLDALQAQLNNTQSELEAREARVKELESILHRKDSIVNALKDKVADALYGFEKDGLTVHLKNGKVYVSMENQLLFKSGSYTVDAKGKDAILKLAKVLEKNPDISILVEGHTDTDAYNGSGALSDNWDLSVIRATRIVKILTDAGNIDPHRITAAGRGEFHPLDEGETKEAKAKNRRIEIILSPKLDELFEILESN